MTNDRKTPVSVGVIILTLVGALVSLGLMLYAGRKNNSILLIGLFVGWVLSPFIGLFVLHNISKRWPSLKRRTIYILMIAVTIGSLVGYSGVLTPRTAKPAFIFLIVPLLSWIAIVITIAAATRSRQLARKK